MKVDCKNGKFTCLGVIRATVFNNKEHMVSSQNNQTQRRHGKVSDISTYVLHSFVFKLGNDRCARTNIDIESISYVPHREVRRNSQATTERCIRLCRCSTHRLIMLPTTFLFFSNKNILTLMKRKRFNMNKDRIPFYPLTTSYR